MIAEIITGIITIGLIVAYGFIMFKNGYDSGYKKARSEKQEIGIVCPKCNSFFIYVLNWDSIPDVREQIKRLREKLNEGK